MHADRELERTHAHDPGPARSRAEPARDRVGASGHDSTAIFPARTALRTSGAPSEPTPPALAPTTQPMHAAASPPVGAAYEEPATASRTLEDELQAIFANDLTLEANLGYLASSLDARTRDALLRRLEDYRPGSGDVVGASFARLDTGRAARVLAALRSGRGATSENEARAHAALQVAEADAATLSAELMPAYLAARDALDPAAVAELGGYALAVFARMRGARDAAKMLDPLTTIADPAVDAASTTTALGFIPYHLNGRLVADLPPTVSLDGRPELAKARLGGELQRTLGLIETVHFVENIVHSALGQDPTWLERAEAKIWPWRTRPVDLAFLRAALWNTWLLLDAGVGPDDKLDDAFVRARAQAGATGWYSDTGKFDLAEARMWLGEDTRDGAEMVLSRLYTADPDTRALLLSQLDHSSLLDPFLDRLGWAQIKALHDSLGVGFGAIKTTLQARFLGHEGFGPSLDREWNMHATSLAHYADQVPVLGTAFNAVADMATFGFHGEYGKLHDDLEEGTISGAEWTNGWENLAVRTYVVGMASLMTAGLAEEATGGAAATQTALQKLGMHVATNAVLSTTTLATTDAVRVWVTREQSGFSSPADYAKAAALGGAMGIAGFGLGQLGARARAYLARFGREEAHSPAAFRTQSPGERAVDEWSRTRDGAQVIIASHLAGADPEFLNQLTPEQRALFDLSNQHVSGGWMYDAIATFDQLVQSGISREQLAPIEDAISTVHRMTPVSVYRDPHAFLPVRDPATGRTILSRIEPTAWGGVLYHGVSLLDTSYTPEVVFERGFPARNTDLNLLSQSYDTRVASQPSHNRAFRGTGVITGPLDGLDTPAHFTRGDGWVYKIDQTPSWYLNQITEGRVSEVPGEFRGVLTQSENEKSVLACIPTERIVGAYRYVEVDGTFQPPRWVANPRYQGKNQ